MYQPSKSNESINFIDLTDADEKQETMVIEENNIENIIDLLISLDINLETGHINDKKICVTQGAGKLNRPNSNGVKNMTCPIKTNGKRCCGQVTSLSCHEPMCASHRKQKFNGTDNDRQLCDCINYICLNMGMDYESRKLINQHNIEEILGIPNKMKYNHISTRRRNANKKKSHSAASTSISKPKNQSNTKIQLNIQTSTKTSTKPKQNNTNNTNNKSTEIIRKQPLRKSKYDLVGDDRSILLDYETTSSGSIDSISEDDSSELSNDSFITSNESSYSEEYVNSSDESGESGESGESDESESSSSESDYSCEDKLTKRKCSVNSDNDNDNRNQIKKQKVTHIYCFSSEEEDEF